MAESALPFPTPDRVAFARELEAGRVRWYNHDRPVAHHTFSGREVTSELVDFVAADLAVVPRCAAGLSSIAELTDDGKAWLLSVADREDKDGTE